MEHAIDRITGNQKIISRRNDVLQSGHGKIALQDIRVMALQAFGFQHGSQLLFEIHFPRRKNPTQL